MESYFLNIIAFLFTIFLLVIIHEFGHFFAARRLGMAVERFSIGFGKPLWKRTSKKGTEFALAPILIGGYVKLDQDSYLSKPVWRRIVVMAAGVAANILLAIVIFWAVFAIGIKAPRLVIGNVAVNSIAYNSGLKSGEEIKQADGKPVYSWEDLALSIIEHVKQNKPVTINQKQLVFNKHNIAKVVSSPILSLGIKPYYPPIPAKIGQVMKNSPADQMGLKQQDMILAVNGKKANNWIEFTNIIKRLPDQQVKLTVQRAGRRLQISGYTGDRLAKSGKREGYLGIMSQPAEWPPDMMITVRYPPLQAIGRSLQRTWFLFSFNIWALTQMVAGKLSLQNLGGPITIYSVSAQAVQLGFISFLSFLGLLSLTIAFINLLPIPGLDGGNLIFLIYEAIFRKPVSPKVQAFALRIGFIIIAIIMFIAIWNDILRLFKGG